jgi:LysR family transcriptional regulator, cys regulon transcriptional activator
VNFQQLRIVRETVKRNFNLTEVANALYISQPGVSKHLRDLEDELGIEIFVRRGKRLLGLSEPGRELVGIVERMLADAKNMKHLAQQFGGRDQGHLTVATTHTQARYALPRVVTDFKRRFPRVHLRLHQGSPTEILQMLIDGDADFAIATEGLTGVKEIVSFPYYSWHHAVIVPAGHPLESDKTLTLERIADYPIITYHEGFTGRTGIDRAFAQCGLAPDIVMSALDADVIKTYVELGLGVGIVASMAFNPARDGDLRLLDSSGLFGQNVTRIAIRRGHYLSGFAYRFIEMCTPELTESTVRDAVAPERGDDADE